MTDRDLLLQAIDLIGNLKGREKAALAGEITALDDFERLDGAFLSRISGRRVSLKEKPIRLIEKAEIVAEQCLRDRIGTVTLGEWDYPANLAQTSDPPFRLYYRGQAPRSDWEGIAVVGTRLPTWNAKSEAFQLGLELAMMECPLISGLALGIDGEAHRGALAASGFTIAVLGSGVDLLTPQRNRKIGQDILMNGGTILSEYAPGTPAAPWRFPARNRIIAGLSRTVVVVQAPLRSGALITADFALDEGRDVAVTPAGAWAEGSAKLMRDGAAVVESAADILGELNIDTGGWESPCLPDPENRDELVLYMDRELKGEVICHGGRYYRVS
ncbi:MAG: DNA-processing protein DprA [Spirochaetales bacterium]|nr:DNA-processing protein DprA [Spirochaetales bacterium]